MKIKLGYQLVHESPPPTPMLPALSVHHTRVADLVVSDRVHRSGGFDPQLSRWLRQ